MNWTAKELLVILHHLQVKDRRMIRFQNCLQSFELAAFNTQLTSWMATCLKQCADVQQDVWFCSYCLFLNWVVKTWWWVTTRWSISSLSRSYYLWFFVFPFCLIFLLKRTLKTKTRPNHFSESATAGLKFWSSWIEALLHNCALSYKRLGKFGFV